MPRTLSNSGGNAQQEGEMDPYLGEIKLITYPTIIPKGWLECNGALLQISQNQALFSLLGTNYGGDGKTTFGIPDMRGRVPVGTNYGAPAKSAPYGLATVGGADNVTLTEAQMPQHSHVVRVSTSPGTQISVANNIYAGVPPLAGAALYAPFKGNPLAIDASSFQSVGGNQPHSNMQPFLVLRWIIAVYGDYPPHP
jgi:microcystin-dependent protein